jgi:acyl-CoA thioester hydrolase
LERFEPNLALSPEHRGIPLKMPVHVIFFRNRLTMVFPERIKIRSYTITIVPRYAETDQGGVVHHSVYPVWFEMGRTELLRVNGLAYKDLEQAGVFFVVAELSMKYRQPARYDEKLQLETTCSAVSASKVEHTYKLCRCCDGVILAEGTSVLACVNGDGTIRRIPEFMYPEPE